jgi:UDP-2,3-diacylglucosamine hydrolase
MNHIVLLGDAHLRDGDPEVDRFLEFLESLPSAVSALYLLGDLFDLWIGAPALITPGHRRVVEALDRLRGKGLRVSYVEGNRDYHLRPVFHGIPFDDLEEKELAVSFGPRKIHLAHGDLVNRGDRPYRLWRSVAKGPVLMAFFRLLPRGPAGAAAQWLERRIARTNVRHRVRFPEEACRSYALERLREGFDTVVLGHFHQEMEQRFEGKEGGVEVFVLPAWREGRRYLRIGSDGTADFNSFLPGDEADVP